MWCTIIDLHSSENKPEIDISEHKCDSSWGDHFESFDFHKISCCPFCGKKIQIEVVEKEDVTKKYRDIQKEANQFYTKANNCDSKKKEQEYRQQGHEISKKLEWYLTTDSIH